MSSEVVSRLCSEDSDPIQLWFNLSGAKYLVLPRSVLQSMPVDGWQRRFVGCLEELDAAFAGQEMPDYYVKARKGVGFATYQGAERRKFVRTDDPFANYERGRRIVPLKFVAEAEL